MFKIRRIFKSLVAALLAACVSVSMVMPVCIANADDVLYGDVNNDGSVTLADVVSLNKYLSGMVDLNDYTKADVNENYIIDYLDRALIQAYIVRTIDSLPYQIPESEGEGA